MHLVLASNNKKKIAEIVNLLPGISIRTIREAGYLEEIPEPFETFRENALQKAKTIYDWCGLPSLADDSGLCVNALDGRPGVHSARYAGVHGHDTDNNTKLLRELEQASDRSAYYVAMLCLVFNGETHFFEGRCEGRIAHEPRGDGGFGYDPIFIPDGYRHTFGEIDAAIKEKISHRAKALLALKNSGLLAS